MDEPLADFYYDKLQKTDRPIPLLVSFIGAVFDFTDKEIKFLYPKIGRAVKLYGKRVVFFAILDSAEGYTVDTSNVHRLIFYFSKKKLENKYKNLPDDLTMLSNKQLDSFTGSKELVIPELTPTFTDGEKEKMESLEMTIEEMEELKGKVIF